MLVSSSGTPKGFDEILATIRTTEEAMVREFGLGLNPAMHKGRVLSEITAFERMKGLHFSLGAKHTVYKKPGINAKRSRARRRHSASAWFTSTSPSRRA